MDEERASAYIKGVKRVSRIWMTPQAINGYDELGWPQTQNFEAPKHFNFHKSKNKSNKGRKGRFYRQINYSENYPCGLGLPEWKP